MTRPALTIYENGVPRPATDKERALPGSAEAPFRGCPTFVVVNGHKHWCQGTKINHEGTHCG